MVFEVNVDHFKNDGNNAGNEFTLSDIPQKVRDPLGGKDLNLKGVLNFIAPRRVIVDTVQQVGHYTAICFRENKEWVEYNDIGPTQQIVLAHRKVIIHAVIYFRP